MCLEAGCEGPEVFDPVEDAFDELAVSIGEGLKADTCMRLSDLDGTGLRTDITRRRRPSRYSKPRVRQRTTTVSSRTGSSRSPSVRPAICALWPSTSTLRLRRAAFGATHTHLRHIVGCSYEVDEASHVKMVGGVRVSPLLR